jgi:hypothetical protein
VHLAAREHIGEFMPDQLADAELALRAARRLIAMLVWLTWHFSLRHARA